MFLFPLFHCFQLEDTDEQLFDEFLVKYEKQYTSQEEEIYRFNIFKENLERIRLLNKKRSGKTDAIHDINEFSDLLDNELPFNQQLHPFSFSERNNQTERKEKHWNQLPPLPDGNILPETYAFCGEYVKQNKERPQIDFCGDAINQGRCSGCWATSLANLAQYLYSNLTYERYGCIKSPLLFSSQRFLDITRTKTSKRCCGGNPKDAIDAVPSFSLNNDYPFVDSSSNGKCIIRGDQNPNVQIQMIITGYKTFGIRKEENMVLLLKKLLHHYGPFLVSLKASGTNFKSYSSGIFEFPSGSVCDTSSPSFMTDHEVVLMGWGKEDNVEYFIIRNSWARGWGEYDNYMRIKTSNLCGIGWRIGDNVYPLNMIVFAHSCKFDIHCISCDINSNLCSTCEKGYKLNDNNKCIQQ